MSPEEARQLRSSFEQFMQQDFFGGYLAMYQVHQDTGYILLEHGRWCFGDQPEHCPVVIAMPDLNPTVLARLIYEGNEPLIKGWTQTQDYHRLSGQFLAAFDQQIARLIT
jgi:hypothetical protein